MKSSRCSSPTRSSTNVPLKLSAKFVGELLTEFTRNPVSPSKSMISSRTSTRQSLVRSKSPLPTCIRPISKLSEIQQLTCSNFDEELPNPDGVFNVSTYINCNSVSNVIHLGMQVCLPSIPPPSEGLSGVPVFIHNLDTPTMSTTALRVPVIVSNDAKRMLFCISSEIITPELSIKFLFGTLQALDLRLGRAKVLVHLIAKSDGALEAPEQFITNTLNASSDLLFYKNLLSSPKVICHTEQYDVPLSRIYILQTNQIYEENINIDISENPYLTPATINEDLFANINLFTGEKMDVAKNPILDPSARVSKQSIDALVQATRTHLHGINDGSSPYYDRNLTRASQIISSHGSRIITSSTSRAISSGMPINCSQDPSMGSLMDDFVHQRGMIEKRLQEHLRPSIKRVKELRARSLPQKLTNIPIVMDAGVFIEESTSALDEFDLEPPDALVNDFVKAITPIPSESFYTICNWNIKRSDTAYDLTIDTGYLQHPVFLRTLRSLNNMARDFHVSAEMLRSLQLDYLHEYKLHITAVYNRHMASVQMINLQKTPITKEEYITMSAEQKQRRLSQQYALALVRSASSSISIHYSNVAFNQLKTLLNSTNNLSDFTAILCEKYCLAFKPTEALRLSQASYLKAITGLRQCITWSTTYRSIVLPSLQDICERTNLLKDYFFQKAYVSFVSVIRNLLLLVKEKIDTLMEMYNKCKSDCDTSSDTFQGKLAMVRPDDWDVIFKKASEYSSLLIHPIANNYTKVLSKLFLVFELITKILSQECTDIFHCIKSLFFLYWRSIVPFQLILLSGELYYQSIIYLMNLHFQARAYADNPQSKPQSPKLWNHLCSQPRASNIASSSKLTRLTTQMFTDDILTYNEYLDSCIKNQYLSIIRQHAVFGVHPYPLQRRDVYFVRDLFGIIAHQDYTKLRYNPTQTGIRKPLKVVLGCSFQTISKVFLSAARHLSASFYPILIEFVHLFNTEIISTTEFPEKRHFVERKPVHLVQHFMNDRHASANKSSCDIKNTSRESRPLDTTNRGEAAANLDLYDQLYNYVQEYTHKLTSKSLENEITSRRFIDISVAQTILYRLSYFGFIPLDSSFQATRYGIVLNLILQFNLYLSYKVITITDLKLASPYSYYLTSVEQLEHEILKLRTSRINQKAAKSEQMRLAIDHDAQQLAKHKVLSLDDLYATTVPRCEQLYASLSILDAAYSEQLKSIKLPLDYELKQILQEISNIDSILFNDELKLAVRPYKRNSDTNNEIFEPLELHDDLECLREGSRLSPSPLLINSDLEQEKTIIIYSQPNTIEAILDPSLPANLSTSLNLAYEPKVEHSVVPLWNMALDLCALFFTLPIMMSLHFDYFFPAQTTMNISFPNPASPDKQTYALSLSLIDFYSAESIPAADTASQKSGSRSSSTRRNLKSGRKISPTDKQLAQIKVFYSKGIFSTCRLEDDVADFLHSWNTLTEQRSIASLLGTQQQLVLPSTERFKNTILASTCLQEVYSDTSHFSLITGTAFEIFGYCSFLNIADYTLIDYRLINDRFEGITATTRLVLDIVGEELLLDKCYASIQHALTTDAMKRIYGYITAYSRGLGEVIPYKTGTILCSILGSSYMWRLIINALPAISKIDAAVCSEIIEPEVKLSSDIFTAVAPPTTLACDEYSILSPNPHEVIPLFDINEMDTILEHISSYDNGFQTFPHTLHNAVFCIAFHEFRRSVSSLITYYRYLYIYVQYVALLFIVKICDYELLSLEANLSRPISSPNDALSQQALLAKLTTLNLSDLFFHLYNVCIVQYEDLYVRFPDIRSVFNVDDFEMTAFSVIKSVLKLKAIRSAAEDSIARTLHYLKELIVYANDWIISVSTILIDRLKEISTLTALDISQAAENPILFREAHPTLANPVVIPPISNKESHDPSSIEHNTRQAFMRSLSSTTSLPIFTQSSASNVTSPVATPSALAACRPPLYLHNFQQKQTSPYSISCLLSELYYLSNELLSIDRMLEKWRYALFSEAEISRNHILIDLMPSLGQINLYLQLLYTVVVYPKQLELFISKIQTWTLPALIPYIPELHNIIEDIFAAIQTLSLSSHHSSDDIHALIGMRMTSLCSNNKFLKHLLCQYDNPDTLVTSETLHQFSLHLFTIKNRVGSCLATLLPISWEEYLSTLRDSLQHLCTTIVCLDILSSPILSPFHLKAVHSYFKTSDSSSISEMLRVVSEDSCGPELLAHIYINAHANSCVMQELSGIEDALRQIVFASPKQLVPNSMQLDGAKHPILVPCFSRNDVLQILTSCENSICNIISRSRKLQADPIEPTNLTLRYISYIQSSTCLSLGLLACSEHLLQATYIPNVHQKIKDLRATIEIVRSLYNQLLRLPRLLSYALGMYEQATLLLISVTSKDVNHKLGYSTTTYSVNSLTMSEATNLVAIYDHYVSLVNNKLGKDTLLVYHALDSSFSKWIMSAYHDLEIIVHRLVTTPFLHILTKFSPKIPVEPSKYNSFSTVVSVVPNGTLHLKRIIPYVNKTYHFLGALFPPWSLVSYSSPFSGSNLLIGNQQVRNPALGGITAFTFTVTPSGRQRITALTSHSEVLHLLQPVDCPLHNYSLPDTLYSPIMSSFLRHCTMALIYFTNLSSSLVPLEAIQQELFGAYPSLTVSSEIWNTPDLIGLCNDIVIFINNTVYDAFRVGVSATIGRLLIQQLEQLTPDVFINAYISSNPVLTKSYFLILILLYVLKTRIEESEAPFPLLRHDTTYIEAMRVWLIEQYMLFLSLEHDLYVELYKERGRDNHMKMHILDAISHDNSLIQIHGEYLSPNKVFNFMGKSMKEYLYCTVYPIAFWRQLLPHSNVDPQFALSLSNDTVDFGSNLHWLGAPHLCEHQLLLLPHLYLSLIRVVEVFNHTNLVFLLLDKGIFYERNLCPRKLPYFILTRISRMILWNFSLLTITSSIFDTAILELVRLFSCGFLIGIVGFHLLSSEHQTTIMHILESLRHPTSVLLGLSLVVGTSTRTQSILESRASEAKWHTLTIDDQIDLLKQHLSLRDATVTDALARPHGVGKVIIFLPGLLPMDPHIQPASESMTQSTSSQGHVTIIEQLTPSLYVTEDVEMILQKVTLPRVIHFSFYINQQVLQHTPMKTVRTLLKPNDLLYLQYNDALSKVTFKLLQLGVAHLHNTDGILILSRCAAKTPLCIAFTLLCYLFTHVYTANLTCEACQNLFALIKTTIVTTIAIVDPDSSLISDAIDAYLRLFSSSPSIPDKAFYKYIVKYFYPYFSSSYIDRLSILMLRNNHSFFFVYAVSMITDTIMISTDPLLLVSSRTLGRELLQFVCTSSKWALVRATSSMEFRHLLVHCRAKTTQYIILYQPLIKSELQAVYNLLLDPNCTVPVVVQVSHSLFLEISKESTEVFAHRLIIPPHTRCFSYDLEVFVSPILAELRPNKFTPYFLSNYQATSISHTFPTALRLDASFRAQNLENLKNEVNILLQGHDPSFITSLAPLFHVITSFIDEHFGSVFKRTATTIIKEYRLSCFKQIFGLCLRGVMDLVEKVFIALPGGAASVLMSSKLIASLFWYNLFKFKLVQHRDASSYKTSPLLMKLDDHLFYEMDLSHFFSSADGYRAYLLGDLTALYQCQQHSSVSTHVDASSFQSLKQGPIPSQIEFFFNQLYYLDMFYQLHPQRGALIFCEEMIDALFLSANRPLEGFIHLLIFLFFAAWNAHSLLYLILQTPALERQDSSEILASSLVYSLKQLLLQLFNLNSKTTGLTAPCFTSGYLFAALKTVCLLDFWEQSIHSDYSNHTYEDQEESLCVYEFIHRRFNFEHVDIPPRHFRHFPTTIYAYKSAFYDAVAPFHNILQSILNKVDCISQNLYSDLFVYVLPKLERHGMVQSQMSLTLLSYELGAGLLSDLSSIPQNEVLDSALIEGVLSLGLKKVELRAKYKEICSEDFNKSQHSMKSHLKEFRTALLASAIAYSYGIGLSSSPSIQQPLQPYLLIDAPRAALVTVIVGAIFSAILYSSGVPIAISGDAAIGKTTLIDTAKRLMQHLTGYKALLPDSILSKDLLSILRVTQNTSGVKLVPNEAFVVSAWVFQVHGCKNLKTLNPIVTRLTQSSVTISSHAWSKCISNQIMGDFDLQNTVTILECSEQSCNSANSMLSDIVCFAMPKITSSHALSLFHIFYSSQNNICFTTLQLIISFLFSEYPALLLNYSFISSLQYHLCMLPLLKYAQFLEAEPEIDNDKRTFRTIYAVFGALRSNWQLETSQLVSMLSRLQSYLANQGLDFAKVNVAAPCWKLAVTQAYANSMKRKNASMTDTELKKMVTKTLERIASRQSISTLTFSSFMDLTSSVRGDVGDLDVLKSIYYLHNVTMFHAPERGKNHVGVLLLSDDQALKGSTVVSYPQQRRTIVTQSTKDTASVAYMDILTACGYICINMEWFQQFVQYFEVAIADSYLEHIVYDQQLQETKIRLLPPPSSPRYFSPSLAIHVFEVFTVAKARREQFSRILSHITKSSTDLPIIRTLRLTVDPYTIMKILLLKELFLSSKGFEHKIMTFILGTSEAPSPQVAELRTLLAEHALTEPLLAESMETTMSSLLHTQNEASIHQSAPPVESQSSLDGATDVDLLRDSLDLRLSDLREEQTSRSDTAFFKTITLTINNADDTAPLAISAAQLALTPNLPCYRISVPVTGIAEFHQVAYLIQLLGNYTPFLNVNFEYLFQADEGSELPSSPHTDRSSVSIHQTKYNIEANKPSRVSPPSYMLFDIDTIVSFITSILVREKSNQHQGKKITENFIKQIAIAILEISAYLKDYDPDCLAVLMLLRTAICFAVGFNPIYMLYKANLGAIHSRLQFGHVSQLAQLLLDIPDTISFTSNVPVLPYFSSGYVDKPLNNVHEMNPFMPTITLEHYITSTFFHENSAIQESAQRFDQSKTHNTMMEQQAAASQKTLVEPIQVTIVISKDMLATAAKTCPSLYHLLLANSCSWDFLNGLFTPEELATLLTALSTHRRSRVLLKHEDLYITLASVLTIYVVSSHPSSFESDGGNTFDSKVFGIVKALSLPDFLNGSVRAFSKSLLVLPDNRMNLDAFSIDVSQLNPLSCIQKYTLENLQLDCKVTGCELPRLVNLPEQLNINWGVHNTVMLLTCLSLHKVCSQVAPLWTISFQAYVKLVSSMIGLICIRAQQFYANVNSTNNLLKAYATLVRAIPNEKQNLLDEMYLDVYNLYFHKDNVHILPVESISVKFLQFFLRNITSQNSKSIGELCYMRNCLYSVVETYKEYSKTLATMLRQLCYEIPILIAYMIYGITGLLDNVQPDNLLDSNPLDLLVCTLQSDGFPVFTGSSQKTQSSLSTKHVRLFHTFDQAELRCESFFFQHLQLALCADTPLFLTETIFNHLPFICKKAQPLLRKAILLSLLGRRIFLTYSEIASPLAFTLIANTRRFDTPFYCLYDILRAAANSVDPLQLISKRNSALSEYIHQTRQRWIELDIQQPYKQFCTSLAKTLAESDNAIIFTNIGRQGVYPGNYSIIKKLFLLATTQRIEARQQLTFGTQSTYLFQPLSEFIFILALAPEHQVNMYTSSISQALQYTGLHDPAVKDSIVLLCDSILFSYTKSKGTESEMLTNTLITGLFGPEFTSHGILCYKDAVLSRFAQSVAQLINLFHNYIIEYGSKVFQINDSLRDDRKMTTADAYARRRISMEAVLIDFAKESYNGGICYTSITFSGEGSSSLLQPVSSIIDTIREVCLMLYTVIPATAMHISFADVYIRRTYTIGDDVCHFSISQTINILNELQLKQLFSAYWYTQLKELANIALDILYYIRRLIIEDPGLLVATSKVSCLTLQQFLKEDVTKFVGITLRTLLKQCFSVERSEPNKNVEYPNSENCEQNNRKPDHHAQISLQSAIIVNFMQFSYDLLRYPLLYYILLYPYAFRSFVIQKILNYAFHQILISAVSKHQTHCLFICLYTLSMTGAFEEDTVSCDICTYSSENFDSTILANRISPFIDTVLGQENHNFTSENIELLFYLFRPYINEVVYLTSNCLLSSDSIFNNIGHLSLESIGDMNAVIPPLFIISKRAKQLFLVCTALSQLTKKKINLLPHFTDNSASIFVCTQYSCLLLTVVSLYLADTKARNALEKLIARNHTTSKATCNALDKIVKSAMDPELRKDLMHLNLTHMPAFLQTPTMRSIYLAFVLSVFLYPESFDIIVVLALQLFGQFEVSHMLFEEGKNRCFVRITEQSAQCTSMHVTIKELDLDTVAEGLSDEETSIPPLCICEGTRSIICAAQSMFDSILSRVEKGSEFSFSRDSVFYFPLTIVFCDDIAFFMDSLLLLHRKYYADRERYAGICAPMTCKRPNCWTDFHLNSIIYILSNSRYFLNELQYFLYLICEYRQHDADSSVASPVWLIIPNAVTQEVFSLTGDKSSTCTYLLEYLVHLVRPIVITYKTPDSPSAFYRLALTKCLLNGSITLNNKVDNIYSVLMGLLHHACAPLSMYVAPGYISRFIEFASLCTCMDQNQALSQLSVGLSFTRAMNILLFTCTFDYVYFNNKQLWYSLQKRLDYYIILMTTSTPGVLPILGDSPSHIACPPMHTSRTRSHSSSVLTKTRRSSQVFTFCAIDKDDLRFNSASFYQIYRSLQQTYPKLTESAVRSLTAGVSRLLFQDRVLESCRPLSFAINFYSQRITNDKLKPHKSQIFTNVLLNLMSVEAQAHQSRLSSLTDFRQILAAQFTAIQDSKGHIIKNLDTRNGIPYYEIVKPLFLGQNLTEELYYHSLLRVLAKEPSIEIPEMHVLDRAKVGSTQFTLWRLSSHSGGAYLYRLLVLLRILTASQLKISFEQTHILAFIEFPVAQPYIDDTGTLSFKENPIDTDTCTLSYDAVWLQMTELTFLSGTHDILLQSIVSDTGEQNQGYSSSISIYFTAIPLVDSTSVAKQNIKLPPGFIFIPIWIGAIYLPWLILPQNSSVQLSPEELSNVIVIPTSSPHLL